MAVPAVINEQLTPVGATPEELYTVPALRRARVSVYASNDTAGALAAVVHLVKSGDSVAATNLLVPNVSVGSKNETAVAGGAAVIYLSAGDAIWAGSNPVNLVFFANGYEDDIPV